MKAYVVDKYKKNEPFALLTCLNLQWGLMIFSCKFTPPASIRSMAKFVMVRSSYFYPTVRPSSWGTMWQVPLSKVGNKVSRFKVGDEIYARPRDHRVGTFAEYIAIHESDAALKPTNLSMTEAASIPLVALTAWQALVEVGKVKPGQRVFIQAGSGGVGVMAIQIAKHLGAFVATTVSSGNIDMVKGLGADLVIDYKTQDFEQLLSGYDLVLNSQDAKTLDKSLNVLKRGGKAISISGPPDPAFAKKLRHERFFQISYADAQP